MIFRFGGIAGIAFALIFAAGCGGEVTDKTVREPEIVEQPAPDLSAFQAEVRERFASGDTIPVAHEKLELLLPDKIEGYTLDKRESDRFDTGEYAFSEATFVFYNDNNEYLEITLADYIADTLFFINPLNRYALIGTAQWGSGTARPLSAKDNLPPNAFGWVSHTPSNQMARAFVGIGYRYALNIEVAGQSDFALAEKVLGMVDIPGTQGSTLGRRNQ